MTQKDPLVVRESRTTSLIALCICILLLGIGSLSLRGPFHLAAIGFMILITGFMIFILWSISFVTVFTSIGLQGRSFGKRWMYSWEEVESWGLEYSSNGEYSIWFRGRDTQKRHYIQALDEIMKGKVQSYFQQHCGKPREEV